ncbi:MAG: hypothetical protein NVSMB13_16640 [Mycobacteriales bacterium]
MGCGTGNVALQVARLGAQTIAVDHASRLQEVTAEATRREGLALDVRDGTASKVAAPQRQR